MSDDEEVRRACADTAAAVLAGGKSRRMGRPKPFLTLGGRPLIGRVIDALREVFSEIFIVTPEDAPFLDLGLPVVADSRPGSGALGGVYTALKAAGLPRVLVVACDMPFLNPDLLAHMAFRAGGHGAAVPRAADGLHPLHAVYAKRSHEALATALDRGAMKLMDVLPVIDSVEVGEAELRRFDPDLHSLFNVNRPQDLERARAVLSARRPEGRAAQAGGGRDG